MNETRIVSHTKLQMKNTAMDLVSCMPEVWLILRVVTTELQEAAGSEGDF